ncbi:hypothetical protein NN6n1_13270 [Shinella zoogloeoides]
MARSVADALIKPFVWGAGGAALTPEELAKRREQEAAALGKIDMSPVYHPLQGLARVAEQAAGAFRRGQLDSEQTASDDYNQTIVQGLLGGASSGGSSIPMTGAAGEVAATAPTNFDATSVSPEIRAGIVETANALGIDPVDLGTAISYETGGTFDPTKAGPTTQWGQHRGLIQFGEPQAEKYGVDWSNPVGSQLGADGAVAKYLRDTGVQPGMGLMDIYSAINAGGVGRYGASDANNGGAPGTVADKVNQQMAGHRAKALALIGQGASPEQAVAATAAADGVSPSRVASALVSPSSGNAGVQAIEAQMAQPFDAGRFGDETPIIPVQGEGSLATALAAGNQDAAGQQAIEAQTTAIPQQFQGSQQLVGANGGITPALMEGQPANSQQVAQALALGQQPQRSQINPAILRALADPRANAQTRGVAELLLKQSLADQQAEADRSNWMFQQQYQEQAQARDPLRQAQIEAMRRKAQGLDKDETFFGNPVAVQNQDGTISYGQIGNKGSFRPIQLGEGQTFAPPTKTVDTGTESILMDQAGNVISRTPKQNRQEAFEKAEGGALGKAQGEAAAALPGDIQQAEQTIANIDALIDHPGLDAVVGPLDQYRGTMMMGAEGRDALTRLKQLQGGAFLQAFGMLKGGGQITEVEGAKAEAAMARMDRALREDEFKAALRDFRGAVSAGIDKMRQRAGASGQGATSTGKRLRFNPSTGELE